VLSLRRPGEDAIRAFISRHTDTPLSYPFPGMTREPPSPEWNVGREQVELGAGAATYDAACAAVDRWAMFRVGWVELCWPDEAPVEGKSVAVLARLGPVWSLNACRVTYVVRDVGDIERHGFAYGTLAEHMETGEERFAVSWDRSRDLVTYEVVAYSRPRHRLARLGGPAASAAQRRFRVDSARAMRRAVAA
jgi:uncharacterized protein (UPF0548 family)